MVYLRLTFTFLDSSYKDHVNFVDNKRDLVHSLASLAGKILHWSYGKVVIISISISPLCTNGYRVEAATSPGYVWVQVLGYN